MESQPPWRSFPAEEAARLLAGEYRDPFSAGVLRLPWRVNDLQAEISWHPPRGEQEARTVACVHLGPRSPGTLKIAPPGKAVVVARMFGPQDLRIGDLRFDASHVIKADPESLAGRVFSPERRAEVIASLDRIGSRAAAFVDLSRSQLRVGVLARLEEARGIFDLARAAHEWTGFLLYLPPPVEIRWIEESLPARGICQVCGSGLTEGVVLCVRCRTPHHRECWEWTGECSTFACHETRFEQEGLAREA